MSFEVSNRHDNALLGRVELEIALSHDQKATPTREDVRKQVAEAESTKAKLVIVKRMAPEFGHGRTRGWVHVYKDEDVLRRLEPQHLLVRHGLVEEAKPEPKKEPEAPASQRVDAPAKE